MTHEVSPMMKIPDNYARQLDEMFAEMYHMNALMDQERAEIDRIKAKNNVLKLETRRLSEETLDILDRLKTAV